MAGAKNILIVNGPNLNLLGSRETRHYGKDTLPAINSRLAKRARQAKVRLETYQSNSESELVDRVQRARKDRVDFIIINPAAYTHTSVALRDALAAVGIPFVEVHLSNIFAREAFRRESYFTDLAVGIVGGLGARGYELALEFALQYSGKRYTLDLRTVKARIDLVQQAGIAELEITEGEEKVRISRGGSGAQQAAPVQVYTLPQAAPATVTAVPPQAAGGPAAPVEGEALPEGHVIR